MAAAPTESAAPDDTGSILPGRPDADKPTAQEASELGEPFSSVSAGVQFSPPAHMKEIRGAPGDVIVNYVDDDRHWVLTVSRLSFDKDVLLTSASTRPVESVDGAAPPTTAPSTREGLLETTASQMKIDAPGVEILRQDLIPLSGTDVGMIAARYSVGPETDLTQKALFRVNDRNYFQFSLTVPAPRPPAVVEKDPEVQAAVQAFNAVLGTVRLLEQTAIREEQNQRLYHTRTLFVNLTPDKLRAALVKEQWLRLIKDGKDIGYSYVVEEVGRDLPRVGHKDSDFTGGDEGPLIGIRSRTYPSPGEKIDAETWMWMSFDRKGEKWSNIALIDKGPDANGKPQRRTVGDVGSSYIKQETVYDKGLQGHGEVIKPGEVDANQPPFRMIDRHMLSVEHLTVGNESGYIGKNQNNSTDVQEVPVFYIPEALAYLLPELLPRRVPSQYMFASYISSKRVVMSRYVDVGASEDVTIGGQPLDAIPIRDRFGLEGTITSNYVLPDGTYVGSISPDTKVEVVPSDAASLQRIWKDVNLSRPGAVGATPAPNNGLINPVQ